MLAASEQTVQVGYQTLQYDGQFEAAVEDGSGLYLEILTYAR